MTPMKTNLDNVNSAVTNYNNNLPVQSSTTKKIINVMASIAFFAGLVGTTATVTMITLSLIASAPISSTVAGIAAGAFALFVIGGVIAYLTRAKESVVAKFELEQELLDKMGQNEKAREGLVEDVQILKQKLKLAGKEIDNLKDINSESYVNKIAEMDLLNINIRELNTQIEKLTNAETQLNLDLKTAKDDLNNANDTVKKTNEYIQLKDRVDGLTEDKKNLSIKIVNLEKTISDNMKTIKGNTETKEEAIKKIKEEAVKEIKNKLEVASKELKIANKKIDDLKELETKMKTAEEKISNLESELVDFSKLISNLTHEEIEHHKKEIDDKITKLPSTIQEKINVEFLKL